MGDEAKAQAEHVDTELALKGEWAMLDVGVRKLRHSSQAVQQATQNALSGIQAILAAAKNDQHIFLASDVKSQSDVVPSEFARAVTSVIAEGEDALRRFKSAQDEAVLKYGWPPLVHADSTLRFDGEERCRHCGKGFAHIWVGRGVCFLCEAACRARGICPFRAACGNSSWCDHLRKCALCEMCSCDQCGLLILDGDDVHALAEQPNSEIALVFLDWDRTCCTTKAGQDPLQGRHMLDAGLHSLMLSTPENVHIVTRNHHSESIAIFLARQGVRTDLVTIHVVQNRSEKNRLNSADMGGQYVSSKGKVMKAELIRHLGSAAAHANCSASAELAKAQRERRKLAIFVDDDMAEHLSDEVVDLPLWRVLFRTA